MRFLSVLILAAMCGLQALPAQAQTPGSTGTPAITEVMPYPNTTTPVDGSGVQVLAPQGEAPSAQQKPKDPCEAYAANIDIYNACHDRNNKIERMKKARDRRSAKPAEQQPVEPAPAQQQPAQQPSGQGGASGGSAPAPQTGTTNAVPGTESPAR